MDALKRLLSAGVMLCAITSQAASDLASLGAKIFFDERLSGTGTVSCASCHRPDRDFADGLSVAIGQGTGTRNTPSLLNVRHHTRFMWDGRHESLDSLVLEPLTNVVEHGLGSVSAALSLMSTDTTYRAIAERDFGRPLTPDDLRASLVAYVATLDTMPSRFDRYWTEGQRDALSNTERYGFELFQGRAQCAQCHRVDGRHPTFTDDQFHAIGLGDKLEARGLGAAALRSASMEALARGAAISLDAQVAALGRFNVSLSPRDIGKYRTPSLRNVASTAPYFHDGSVATLEAAVHREVYYRSLALGRPIVLTPADMASIVAFLRALSAPTRDPAVKRR